MKKYILYAIGEIFLVVVGILIAVSINNWNEERKSQDTLVNILRIYKQDLIIDTTQVGARLRQLDTKIELYRLFLSDTVTVQDYRNEPRAYNLMLQYNPLLLKNKGYQLLKNHMDHKTEEGDSLVMRILTAHEQLSNFLLDTDTNIENDIIENISYFKENSPWFGSLILNKITPETEAYFLSDDYRNRLAIHFGLEIGNLRVFLKQHNVEAAITLDQINSRLENSE